MPRTEVPGFIGGSNQLRASNQDVERTVNFYVEPTAPGQSKTTGGLLPTPCLHYLTTVNGNSSGSGCFYQDGRAFVVVGTTFAEVFDDWTVITRGFVTIADTLPTSIVSNGTAGHQLLIVSGGDGFVFDLNANTLTKIDNTNFPGTGFPVGTALMCEFLDGYGIVLVNESRQFQISALEDFTSWDPLDVAQRSEGSDNLVGVIRNHRELWFPGTKTGEVWYDSGDALFPFAPVPGVFLEYGAACSRMTRIGDTVAWIGLDERGHGMINLANGYQAQRVSTTGVEHALQQSANLAASWVFAYQQEGHTFLWITVVDLLTSWTYDLTTGVWAERAIWDPTACQYQVNPATSFMFAFNTPVVTSRFNGALYELSLTTYADEIAA